MMGNVYIYVWIFLYYINVRSLNYIVFDVSKEIITHKIIVISFCNL
jgi:hypothetical protein